MDALDELTDKEKQTLRLIVRGHDAKSMASELSLSVHTINERLRVARRKLGVTSSREAARLLHECEGKDPEKFAGKDLGDAAFATPGDVLSVPETRQSGGWGKGRRAALLTGGLVMSLIAAALLLATPLASDLADQSGAAAAPHDAAASDAARSFLEMLDAKDWSGSYAATAEAFRKDNTLQQWSAMANSVHGELGPSLARELIGVDDVPALQGLTVVKFRTDYGSRKGALETISLIHEDGAWKVAGIYVS